MSEDEKSVKAKTEQELFEELWNLRKKPHAALGVEPVKKLEPNGTTQKEEEEKKRSLPIFWWDDSR